MPSYIISSEGVVSVFIDPQSGVKVKLPNSLTVLPPEEWSPSQSSEEQELIKMWDFISKL
jgi:hypothetical protein